LLLLRQGFAGFSRNDRGYKENVIDIFFHLLVNILPLYALMALGWVAGRYFEVDRATLGALGVFILMPVVAFGYVAKLDFQPDFIILPFIVYGLLALITLVNYQLGRGIYQDKRGNLLALCASATNTGYFGLPVVLLLMEPQWVAVYIFTMMGAGVYEATIMYYIANRGNFSARESLKRLLRFPTIYAIAAGLLVNYHGLELGAQFDTYWEYFKGSYVVVGMMLIGAALARVDKLVIGPKFLGITFVSQFILWPALVFGLIMLDVHILHWFEPQVYQILFIMAAVPPAANTVAFAAKLNLNPEKAATTVLLGTLLGLFAVPLLLALSGLF